jgi:BirA family biotin operon repressor/biotin-[acetyl-CoA-carboxylase] ligase
VSFSLQRLRGGIKPFNLHYFPRLRSTNDHAAELRRTSKLFAPSLVLTSHQIAGRGRGSNKWWSDAGSITATFIFPVEEHLSPHQVPLAAGLAVRDAAAELCGDDSVALKWPNDIVYKKRKLAGLLCERVNKADLIGIGLNVNTNISKAPKALREQITSLAQIAGKPIDLTDALIALAQHLHKTMWRRSERLFTATLHRYDAHHALIGKTVSVIEAGSGELISGKCTGLDSSGRLVVRYRNKPRAIIAGQVRMH